jgi:hypothetical protein
VKPRLLSTLVTVSVLLLAPIGLTGLGDPAGLAHAQSGGYTLLWWTVDSGGATVTSSSLGYILGGTIGQPDAGPQANGGGFTLAGGFWGGAAVPWEAKVYLPLVRR